MVEVQSYEADAPALLTSGLALFRIIRFPWLHYTSSLADTTMEIKACNLLKAVKLN
jgi:hypothetical protein